MKLDSSKMFEVNSKDFLTQWSFTWTNSTSFLEKENYATLLLSAIKFIGEWQA